MSLTVEVWMLNIYENQDKLTILCLSFIIYKTAMIFFGGNNKNNSVYKSPTPVPDT